MAPSRKPIWPFWVVTAAYVVTMLGGTLPTPLYPLYEQRFGFRAVGVTTIYATYACAVLAVLLTVGPRADRLGRRRTLLAALALGGLSSICFLLAPSEAMLYVGRALSGASVGLYTTVAPVTLTELRPDRDARVAALVSTAAGVAGLGLGPLLAGGLAEYAPDPLRLVFAVHLGMVAASGAAMWAVPEPARAVPLSRGRAAGIAVPSFLRPAFVRAGTVGAIGFALLGIYTSLVPSMLANDMRTTNHALAGAVAALLFAASAAAQLALRHVADRVAVGLGAALVAAALALVVGAAFSDSVPLLLTSALVGGLGQGLSFMGSLAVVHRKAPDALRGSVDSAYFVVTYLAITGPVVGVGVLAGPLGLPAATLVFAAVLGPLALLLAADAARPAAAGIYGMPAPCADQQHKVARPWADAPRGGGSRRLGRSAR